MSLSIFCFIRRGFIAFILGGFFTTFIVAGNPIKVGMSGDLSGPSQLKGKQIKEGASAYFNHINDKGGVLGQRIEFIVKDDNSNVNLALNNTIEFVKSDDVDLLFAYLGVDAVARSLPVLKLFEDKQLHLFFAQNGAEPQRNFPYLPYATNFRASLMQETAYLVEHFVNQGHKKIAVFYQQDAHGRNGFEGVRIQLRQFQLGIHSEASYAIINSTTNMDKQARHIQKSNPDVIIIISNAKAAANFITAVKNVGCKASLAVVSSVGSDELLSLLNTKNREYAEKLVSSEVVPDFNSNLFAAKQYSTLMQRSFPKSQKSRVSFESFLAAKLLVSILEASKAPFTADHLAATLASNRVYDIGLEKPLTIDKRANQASQAVYLRTVSANQWRPLSIKGI
jgi:branched-chain amino acid transport system substrate-binding protein